MADFCKQCSIEIFGEDFHDLANLVDNGRYAIVICEGCGPTLVDAHGNCVIVNCLEHHNEGATRPLTE